MPRKPGHSAEKQTVAVEKANRESKPFTGEKNTQNVTIPPPP
jgi:hypothetical protein